MSIFPQTKNLLQDDGIFHMTRQGTFNTRYEMYNYIIGNQQMETENTKTSNGSLEGY